MDKKPTYAEFEQRVRELEELSGLLSSRLDSFFVDAPAGIAMFDRQCRYLKINQTLADFAGCSIADHLGRRPREILSHPFPEEIEADLQRVMASNEPLLNREISGELPGQSGKVRYWLHSQFPLHDCAGQVAGAGVIVVETTEAKYLLAEVREKELFQRMLLENLPQKIFMKDRNSRYLYTNENYARDLAITPEEMVGRLDDDFHPKALAEKYQADDRLVMALGNTVDIEEDYVIGGETRVIFTRKTPVVSGQGELVGLLGIFDDITERKQAELQLRESEERFRQIAENINSVFWIRDLSTEQTLYISPAYEKIWGRSCESIYQKSDSWCDVVHPEDYGWVVEKYIHRTTRDLDLEFRILRKDEGIRWIHFRAFMVRDQTGREYREVGICEDITEYVGILERMRDSESRYRTFFETSADGVSIYEVSPSGGLGKLVDCNASYLRLAGRGKEELLALADIRVLKKDRGEKGRGDAFDSDLCSSSTHRCSGLYSWLRPDGRQNFIECRGRRLSIKGKEFFHCVHRDITQVKLAEDQIRHLSRRIVEVLEEEQKRIARDLHDEFGQSLLAMRHKFEAHQKKCLAAGMPDLDEVAEIDQLIDTVATAIRTATNRLRPDLLDTLGFLPTLEWGLRDFSRQYPAVQTALEIVGASRKIPPEFEIALYRVFQEGLTNIGKHAKAKTVTVRLIFSYPAIILTLADDGSGFDTDRFAGQIGKSNGIGLRSMQERMLAIGGTFSVRSRPGEGTVLRAEVNPPSMEKRPA